MRLVKSLYKPQNGYCVTDSVHASKLCMLGWIDHYKALRAIIVDHYYRKIKIILIHFLYSELKPMYFLLYESSEACCVGADFPSMPQAYECWTLIHHTSTRWKMYGTRYLLPAFYHSHRRWKDAGRTRAMAIQKHPVHASPLYHHFVIVMHGQSAYNYHMVSHNMYWVIIVFIVRVLQPLTSPLFINAHKDLLCTFVSTTKQVWYSSYNKISAWHLNIF